MPQRRRASILTSLCATVVLFGFLLLSAEGYKWRLKDRIEYEKVLVFSEHYMFASHKGPSMMEEGSSRIVVDVTFTAM
jgi:hypothetical protein